MQIESIWISQRQLRCVNCAASTALRQLRNVAKVVSMQIALSRGNHLPPVTIACCEDNSHQLEDGHHLLIAYWLSGQPVLQPHQNLLVPKERWKPRFGQIE